MSIFQNAYRCVLFLFLFVGTPLCIYSDNFPEFFGNSPKLTENGVIGQKILLNHDLTDTSTIESHKKFELSYYLYISDFINSFISIPTSNVSVDSTTVSSKYLAGRAPLYNQNGNKVGTCSASFLCMQNADGIYTDISNYLSVDNGLIVTSFTPTKLINLELDSIIHSMVTECIVVASTKVGFNPFYGKTFNMIVSSDDEKIYFILSKAKKT